jgi:hypothetical protein
VLAAAATRVRIEDPTLVPDLVRYLRTAGCAAERLGRHEVAVSVPGAPSREQARREIELYLSTWRALNRPRG